MCIALWQSEPSLVRSLFLSLGLLSSAADHLFWCSICRKVIFLWLISLQKVCALSLLKITVFINFTARETLFSFNKLCKDAYSCLFIFRGTSLSTCMTLKLSSSFHLGSLCSLIHGLYVLPTLHRWKRNSSFGGQSNLLIGVKATKTSPLDRDMHMVKLPL